MASRSRRLGTPDGGEPKDTRPIGAFFNADPSSAVFAQNIHVAKLGTGRYSEEKVPAHEQMWEAESGAIASVDRRTLRMHDPLWVKRHPEGE